MQEDQKMNICEKVHCSHFLESETPLNIRYALVILNSSCFCLPMVKNIWIRMDKVICADGGANRLFDSLQGTEEQCVLIPNAICGDLDSLRSDVEQFYRYFSSG